MRFRLQVYRRLAPLAAAAGLGLAACDLDVANPSVIDASTIDPITSGTMFTLSAQTTLWDALSTVVETSGWVSGEAWVTHVNVEAPPFGRRDMVPGTVNQQMFSWDPLSSAVAENEEVLSLLGGLPGAGTDLNVARGAMNAGIAILQMGLTHCVGVIRGGPTLTQAQTLDTAIVRFTRAVEIATAVGGTAADTIRHVSSVGMAYAHLQLGQNANASARASSVPAAFSYSALYVDDLANRGRVSNGLFGGSAGSSWVVPPYYRTLNDPRVPWQDLQRVAFDTISAIQSLKYPSFAAPLQIASGLEATYIVAEAELKLGDAAPALALIAARRSAGGQPAFTGTPNTAEILAELMDQRARDFYMEGKHLSDYVRNPTATPYVPATGTPYYRGGVYGDNTCVPLPLAEIQSNPNIPG